MFKGDSTVGRVSFYFSTLTESPVNRQKPAVGRAKLTVVGIQPAVGCRLADQCVIMLLVISKEEYLYENKKHIKKRNPDIFRRR